MNASLDDSKAGCAPPPSRNLAMYSRISAASWAFSSSLRSSSPRSGSIGIFINFLLMALTLRPCCLASSLCHVDSVSKRAASSSRRARSLLGRARSPLLSGPSGSPLRRRSLAAMMPSARRSSNSTCDSLWRLPRKPSQSAWCCSSAARTGGGSESACSASHASSSARSASSSGVSFGLGTDCRDHFQTGTSTFCGDVASASRTSRPRQARAR